MLLTTSFLSFVKRRVGLGLIMALIMMALNPTKMWADDITITVLEGTKTSYIEGPEKLFDGYSDTKWCTSNYAANGAYVIFKLNKAAAMTGYTIIDGDDTNDASFYGRHWDSWVLYGASFASDADAKTDSESWKEIDSQSGQKYTEASFSTLKFTTKNVCECQYFMLKITGIGESRHTFQTFGEYNLDNCQQMAEMTFTWCTHTYTKDENKCDICGTVKEHTHVFPEASEVAATCTEDSKSHCTLCNELLSDGKTAAFSHSVPAEFTNGIKECSVCHQFIYQSLGEAVDGWYSISNAGQLCFFSQMVTANPTVEYKAKLTADINMSGITSYAPVCYAASEDNLSISSSTIAQPGFKGTFDGQGHTITGLTIAADEQYRSTGLFGNNSGTICNLGIDSYNYDNKGNFDGRFGAVAGVNFGTIRNCYVISSTVSSSGKICGAVTGANYGGKIENCYELGNTINANGRCGHMVGDANNDNKSLKGIITNCYSDSKLGNEGQKSYPGGGQTGETNVSTARFESGEIAYKLNGSESGTTDGSQLWYQKLPASGSDSDAAPVLKRASDGSNTVYRSTGDKCNDISYNNTASVLGAQKHDYAVSKWTWANNGSTAKATFSCKNDASHQPDPIDATVTSALKTAASCSVMGTTTYTASVIFDGKVYTDTKDVQDIPTLSHTVSDGFNANGIKDCSVCHAFIDAVPLDEAVDGWYSISNAGQLISFSQMVTANPSVEYKAKLTADINMSGITAFAPVCYATSIDNLSRTTSTITQPGFKGTFDGQGHTITGLTITPDQNQYSTGLFGNNSGTICNLGIVNYNYDNKGNFDGRFGAVAGVNYGTIRDCYVVSSTVSSSGKICGAVTGANYGGKIENCYEAGNTVNTHSRCGHMVGDANNDGASLKGIIINCYSDNKLGNENQSSYLGQGQTGETNVTAARFASGEITYKLNGGEYGKTDGSQAWFQIIPDGGKSGDSYPVLKDNGTNSVYCTYGETCTDVTYSNIGGSGTPNHKFDYDSPVWTWNENGNDAYVTFTCQRDINHKKVIEATITSAVKTAATCSVKGTNTYTASVKVGEKEYTDSKDVQVETADHTFPAEYTNGIKECSVCHNLVYQPLDEAVDGWYSIGNAGQLISFANKVNDGNQTIKGKLTADINMQGVQFVQIGASSQKPFQGELDGQNFAIKNLNINASAEYAASLIGYAEKVTIQRLTVQGAITTSKKFATGFIGKNINNASKIIKCISAVDIVSTVDGDGTHAGFVGVADVAVTINNCAFVGSITSETGTTNCAGLIGWDTNKGSQATNCYVTATFSSGICEMQLIRNRDANAFATCYFLNACGTSQGTEITAQMVANGELCYKLNGGENGTTDGTQAWYQKLPDAESVESDSYPVLKNTGSNTVYFGYADCQTTETSYANIKMSKTQGHLFADGATYGECTICHKHFNEQGEEVAPTGIKEISSTTPSDSVEEIYDVLGRRKQSLSRGLNIIKQSDGTVRKVLVK